MNKAADSLDELTKLARSIVLPRVQTREQLGEASEVRVFKFVRRDIDGDGQDEICFAAGVRSDPGAFFYSYVGVWLLDPLEVGYFSIELSVPYSDTFRDLLVLDINSDHIPEIVFWFQAGSGAFLSFYVFQW